MSVLRDGFELKAYSCLLLRHEDVYRALQTPAAAGVTIRHIQARNDKGLRLRSWREKGLVTALLVNVPSFAGPRQFSLGKFADYNGCHGRTS